MMRIMVCSAFMVLLMMGAPQAQQQQQSGAKTAAPRDPLNSDQLMMVVEEAAQDKKARCIKSIGHSRFCDCLGENLPVAVNFAQYVVITGSTNEELKYDQLSIDRKQVVDNARSARDKCVKQAGFQ
jgi:hypothetical protein